MKIVSFFVWCLFTASCFGQNDSSEETVRQWEKLENVVRQVIDSALKQALPTLIKANSNAGISPQCSSSVLKLIFGLKKMRTWAFEMLDAAGKPGGGILEGTLIAFGSYDQCLSIVAKDKPGSKEYFRGKYCTVSIHPPVPPKPYFYTMHHKFPSFANFSSSKTFIRRFSKDIHFFLFLSYRLGICIPSTCTKKDMESVLSMILKDLDGVTATVVGCEVKESYVLNKVQIGVLSLLGILFLLVILATGVHMSYRSYKKDLRLSLSSIKGYILSIFLAFSLFRSLKRLFKKESSLRHSKALHGIRTLSLFWIMFGHIFLYSNYQVIRQLKMAVDYSSTPLFQVLVSSPLGFDTFFFLTGYILANMNQLTEKFKLCFYLKTLGHYLIKVLPGYLLLIAIVFIVPITNSGPNWHENLDPMVDACRKNWWSNILFINNFNTSGSEKCLSNSWYVACEFQLFIIGLIVTTLMRWSQIGMALNILLMLLSVCITGVITAYLKLPPTILFSQVDVIQRQEVEDFLFNRPYPHLGPFCLGLALGHLLSSRSSVKLKNYSKILGWSFAITCMASVTFGVYEWNFEEKIATPATTLYAAAHRITWSIGVAWITFLCSTHNGGIINSFLSWHPFQSISRLSMIAYLFHPIILTTLTSHLRERIQITPYVIIFVLCGLCCLSIALSFMCYILIMAPIFEIETLIFGKHVVVIEKKKKLYEKSARIARKLKEMEADGNSDTEKGKKYKKSETLDLEKNKINGCVILHL